MDDESDRSSEATQVEEASTRQEQKNDEEDDSDGQDSGGQNGNDDMVYDDDDNDEFEESSPKPIQEDSRTSQSETLVSGLAEVPIKYAVRQDELEKLKNQLQGSHQEALAIVIAQAAQAHSENQIQLPGVPSSSSQLTPISVPPLASLPSSNSQGQILSTVVREKKNTSDPKTVSSSRTVRTPIDGYNWRKYGQKQVKSPQGSRSYYKCTHPECDAKKIESCDENNSITKIVYKGQHNHDPPKKVFSRGGKIISAKRKSITPGSKQQKSSGSVGNAPIQIEEVDAPEPKRRVKKSNSASPGSVLKRPKKPKFVVHAPADVGISADGYRWRKYGQKMVKGNPHPRNYYKCTSAGCPVRKHIEMAVDGTSEVIITYKGVHDHDMPVPKKGQGSPSGLLVTAASSVSNNDSQSKKSKTISNEVSTTEALNDVEQKKGDDSTRTLLSVGFEIKPC